MTQNFVALRGNAAASATDLGGGNYQLTLTIVDDSGVYTGIDAAAGHKLIKAGDGGTTGQMKVYTITSVDAAFASQVTITVSEDNSDGTPGFGSMAIAEPNSQGVLPIVSGIAQGLQQATTQYNLARLESISAGGDNIYTADGIVSLDRVLTLNGNTVTFKDGTTEAIISAAQFKILNADLEIEGGAAITHSPNGDRWSTTTNNIGASVTVKLP